MKTKSLKLFLGLATFALIAAACTGKAIPTPTQAPAPTTAPVVAPTTAPVSTEAPIAFDGTSAEEEGYWYSRYNLGNLVMRSGLGEQFMPTPEMMQAMIKMVDANPNDGDTVMPPANAALLQSVYASGNPSYTQAVDPTDFGTQRWDPATFDTTVTARAMGWTILKENEWAKQFHVDNHFGTVNDNFGAQFRFVGMVMNASSKMQLQYALTNLMNTDGYFADSNGTVDFTSQWVMLEALSDVGGTLNAEVLPNSASNRYYNPDQGAMFLGAADMLFGALADRQPANIEETSLAIQALTWFAANTQSSEAQFAALNRIIELGDALTATDTANATEKAFAIRGLVEAYRSTGNDAYLTSAASVFDALSADFNPGHGVFDSQHTYTIDNVGVIMGALNSLKFYGGDAVDQAAVEDLFTNFYLNVVNKSGLQQSVPPIPVAKGAFEQEEPTIFYGYPTIPMPPMAGGEFGVAPVFATEVSFDMGTWTVTNANFDSAGAMHTSNEFIWFHNDEVNGFPEIGFVFDGTAAEEEGYWYSRYNLGNLVMRSGLGEQFMPTPEMMQAMMQAVDANPSDGDTVIPPTNPALLQSVYASGDPHYTVKLDINDFATQRWDPATFDTTVTSRAMGWTILKENEWAKQFHVDDHFGTIEDNFGAQWRFVGMVMNASSKMQLQYALTTLKNANGLFANSDGTVDYAGNWVMLEAISDVGGTLNATALPHSATNRYYSPDQAGMFLGAADMLFGVLSSRQPADVEETSLAIQALAWYATNTTNDANSQAALDKIAEFGNALSGTDTVNATEKAFAIRGLVEAYRLTGDDAYLTAAAGVFDALTAEFDAQNGVFSSQSTYTIDNVGVIMGALNSLKFYAGDAVDQGTVEELFTLFYENVVNKSGLQQAAPPIMVAKGEFEQHHPPIFYSYPTVSMPTIAGGEFGVAPVFATEVSWDGSAWSVTNANFDAAGAMHTSNEFIWFHNDEVNGFPELP